MTQEDSSNGNKHSDTESLNANDPNDHTRGRLFWSCWTCGTRNPGSAKQCSHDGTSYTASQHAQQEDELSKPLPREYVREKPEDVIPPTRIPVTLLTEVQQPNRTPLYVGFTLASVALIGGLLVTSNVLQMPSSFTMAQTPTETNDSTADIEPTVAAVVTPKIAKEISEPKLEIASNTISDDSNSDSEISAQKPNNNAKIEATIEKEVATDETPALPSIDEPTQPIVAAEAKISEDALSTASTEADKTSEADTIFHNLISQQDITDLPLANLATDTPIAISQREKNGEIISFHELAIEKIPELEKVVEVPAAAANAMVSKTRSERASALKDSVSSELKKAGFNSLQISVDGPVITINGAMSSQDSKDYALKIVRNHPNVAQVRDKIFVFQQ